MNSYIYISPQLLQTSSQGMLYIIVVSSILVAAYLWFLKTQKVDNDSSRSRISIKIDRNGKHKYDVVPNSGDGNLKFWIKFIIAVIIVAFLWIPIKALLNPQY
ncbi:MAG: hypothetical protein QMB11_05065 [Nonlabens sp.]|uniref:hypothetical protein n=1 Tax=Nonlabens sp. TaxID=1888209 RepID=UPI0035A6A210